MAFLRVFDNKLSLLATELIATAQNFIRENNGIASVSLRFNTA